MEGYEEIEVGGDQRRVDYEKCEPGEVLVVGEYLGAVPSIKFKDKFNYEFLEIDPASGDALQSQVLLYHCGNLTKRMQLVEPGTKVKVTFVKTFTLDHGDFKGSSCHDILVTKFRKAVPEGLPAGHPLDFDVNNL